MELGVLLETIDPMTTISVQNDDDNEILIDKACELADNLDESILGRRVARMGIDGDLRHGVTLYVVLEEEEEEEEEEE